MEHYKLHRSNPNTVLATNTQEFGSLPSRPTSKPSQLRSIRNNMGKGKLAWVCSDFWCHSSVGSLPKPWSCFSGRSHWSDSTAQMIPCLGYRVQFGAFPQDLRFKLFWFNINRRAFIWRWCSTGQVTQEVMTISLLGGFKGSAKAITDQVPFQAEPTDLQKILPTNISVILAIYLICFPLYHAQSWLDWLSKTPSSTCKFFVTGFSRW